MTAESVLVPLWEVGLYALLNPALIAVAVYLGPKADQPAKLVIAGFAGAAAGVALLYLLALAGMFDAPRMARAAGGIFIVSILTGSAYAWIAHRLKHSSDG